MMGFIRISCQAGFLLFICGAVFLLGWNVEAWCPFGGVEAMFSYLHEGDLLCSLGVTNFYVLAGVLLLTFSFRRLFCSHVCPIGTVSEWMGRAGRRLGLPRIKVPPALDRLLGLGKYVMLGMILYLTWQAGELIFRGFDPCYALIGRHGEDVTIWTYIVSGVIVVASLLLMLPFCRWACPLAAVLNLFSRFGWTRIRRHEGACTNCGRCSDACPMAIPVDKMAEVSQARCTTCFECIAACPHRAEGALTWGPPGGQRRSWPKPVAAAGLGVVIALIVAASYVAPFPSFVRTRGDPPAVTKTVEMKIKGVTCRGAAVRLAFFLMREDIARVPGYLRLEAWPGPGFAQVRVVYDPERAKPRSVKDAILEPYFDAGSGNFHRPAFEIEGYAPWALPVP